jgi:hypothetical protein
VGKLTLDDGHDGALLDGRRALETVGVDSTEELSLKVHVVERVGDLIVVGLDLACARVSLCCRILRGGCGRHRCRTAGRAMSSSGGAAACEETHPRPRPQDLCQP